MRARSRGGVLALGLGLWGLAGLLCATTGCKPLGGSETNWFGTCGTDKDCSNGSSCVCGTCSIKCSAESTCADESPNFRCSDGVSSAYAAQCGGPGPAEQGICLVRCESDADCTANHACADGACVTS